MSILRTDLSVDSLNRDAADCLPGFLGVEFLSLEQGRASSRMPLQPMHMAPNQRLHAASLIALADTTTGHATMAHLPAGARSFATIELKSNFFGTQTEGELSCEATAVHLGRSTQVWDATVSGAEGRRLALFRCTQMILWPRS